MRDQSTSMQQASAFFAAARERARPHPSLMHEAHLSQLVIQMRAVNSCRSQTGGPNRESGGATPKA